MNIIYKDPFSDETIVIEKPLLPEHLKVGQLLWYNGFTSQFSWDCPAVITEVDEHKKAFRVRSFDDMLEQTQWYDFSAEEDPSTSRKTMRLVDESKVKAYLEELRLQLQKTVTSREADLEEARSCLAHFEVGVKFLTFAS